jgi:hypothetical protein
MAAGKNETSLEKQGDRALVITRTFNAPPRVVFDAWTRADLVKLYPSKEVLDMVIASGMETGMRETMDQLDELVSEASGERSGR